MEMSEKLAFPKSPARGKGVITVAPLKKMTGVEKFSWGDAAELPPNPPSSKRSFKFGAHSAALRPEV